MKDLQTEREKTEEATAQIACWCIVVALHQTEGIGKERLERCAEAMQQIQTKYSRDIAAEGKRKTLKGLAERTAAICEAEMRVPMNRAPRNRREQELTQAANEAVTTAWQIFALAVHETLRFGRARLDRLRLASVGNYRQFNDWYREDHDWAFEKLRQCAERAMQEEVRVVDQPDEVAAPIQRADPAEIRAAAAKVMAQIARKNAKPLPLAVMTQEKARSTIESIVKGV